MIMMNDEKIKSAQKTIRIAVILRLLLIALLALGLADSYSHEQENILRLYNENIYLCFIIPGFVVDMILTIIWLYRPKWHKVHLVLYVLLGGYFCFFYVFDVFNLYGIGEMVEFFIAPFIWLVGLIPFAVCGIGRDELTKAKAEQDQQ